MVAKLNILIMRVLENYLSVLVAMFFAIALISCKKDNEANTAAPTLTSVTNLVDRTTSLDAVDYGDWIIIKGANLKTTHKVDFNGTVAADSLLYAEDNSVTVKIPANLTDPINNPITVTTKYGSATLNFKIKQPNPQVEDFNPAAGVGGDDVTIKGNYFNGVSSVTIGGVAATVVSNTQTEIKVKVPTGVTYGQVVITTPVGSVTATKTFGIKHFIYQDGLVNSWTNTSYSATIGLASTDNVHRGTTALKAECVGWGAVRFRLSAKFNTTGYSTIKISIFGGPDSEGRKMKIAVTPAAGSYEIVLREGKWTDYQVPLANIGNPATIEYITFQEFSGKATLTYIDDVGFY